MGEGMKNVLVQVLNSTPIDRQAGRVASQQRCVEVEFPIDRAEVLSLLERSQRKQRLLKVVLKVDRPTQHKNLIARYKAGLRSKFRQRRAIVEYVRNGQNIQNLAAHAAGLDSEKAARKQVGAIENKWKAEHPGWIFDGRQLISPTGDVFSRSAVAQSVQAKAVTA